eukprot:c15839_g1_i1.p1 GENE.c15839_g1_i1~~c15839_g1_i1.p1  ORF type:complete len:223 (+),score=45.57 c15839_g1_i1:39-671(+)
MDRSLVGGGDAGVDGDVEVSGAVVHLDHAPSAQAYLRGTVRRGFGVLLRDVASASCGAAESRDRLRILLYFMAVLSMLGSRCRAGDFNFGLSLFGLCVLLLECRDLLIAHGVICVYSVIPDFIWLTINGKAHTQAQSDATQDAGCFWSVVCASTVLTIKVFSLYFLADTIRSMRSLVDDEHSGRVAKHRSFRALIENSYQRGHKIGAALS